MTLNDLEWLFCAKICLRFGINYGVLWLSDKIAWKLVEYTHILSAAKSIVVENGDFRFFRSLATRQLSSDATVDDLGDISRSFDCFTTNFSLDLTIR